MKYIIFLLPIMLYSCSNVTPGIIEDNPELIEIMVDINEADTLKMSDFFAGISYYPLKNPDSEPMGTISKIMFQGDYIALFDQNKKSVWIFTKKGKYVNEVKIPPGKGPGELEHLSDVYFDDEFRVHALGAYKLLIKDIEGNLVDETPLEIFLRYLTYNKGYHYGFSDGSPNLKVEKPFREHNLYKFSKGGEIQNAYLKIDYDKIGISYGVPNYFPIYKEAHYYFQHLSDTVYFVGENTLKPAYVFNFGEQTLSQEIFKKRSNYGKEIWQFNEFWEKEVKVHDYIIYKTNFEITDGYIHSRIGSAHNKYMVLYDREKKHTYVGANQFLNDIDYGPSPFIYMSSDESLYSYVEANDLLRHLNNVYKNDREKYYSNSMRHLRELGNSMRDNSNPILMRLDFK